MHCHATLGLGIKSETKISQLSKGPGFETFVENPKTEQPLNQVGVLFPILIFSQDIIQNHVIKSYKINIGNTSCSNTPGNDQKNFFLIWSKNKNLAKNRKSKSSRLR